MSTYYLCQRFSKFKKHTSQCELKEDTAFKKTVLLKYLN